MTTIELSWYCQECNKPIQDGDGYITIQYGRTTGQHWETLHRACDPHIDRPDYSIDVERARTFRDLTGWTARFMEEDWVRLTDWPAIVRRQLKGSA